MSSKTYLVTGGTGFIGAGVVAGLLNEGHKVRCLDNNSRGNPEKLGHYINDVEMITADIRDYESVRRASKGVDSVVHLAYINGTEFFYEKPELILDVAIRGMLSVIDACRAEGVGDLVLASSSEAYQTPPTVPTDESVPLTVPDILNPRYSYGGGKIACELMAINYGRTGFERVAIFRPHNVYGPNMGWEHVIPQFALRAVDLAKENIDGPLPFKIQGDGQQTRSFIYIDDFVNGVLDVIHKGKHLEIYHIGTEDEVTIAQVAEEVVKSVGREAKLISGPEPRGATPRRCPSIAKLRSLGFSPKVSLREGLKSTVLWYIENQNKRPY